MLKKIIYFLQYLLFLIFTSILRLISLDNAALLCSRLCRFIGPKLGVSNVARRNLQQILNIDPQQTEQIIDGLWDNYGRYIGEFPFINHISFDALSSRIELQGAEHILQYQEQNKPFILMMGHFANWDFFSGFITELYPKFAIVYRKANNPYINKTLINARSSSNVQLIEKGRSGVKKLVAAVKSGYALCMLVDQKMNDGISVPLLGKEAMTADAIAKLSLQYNMPIIPCQIIRKKNKGGMRSHFIIKIHPKIIVEETKFNTQEEHTKHIMLQINDLLGQWILENKDQWFWFHNRWPRK